MKETFKETEDLDYGWVLDYTLNDDDDEEEDGRKSLTGRLVNEESYASIPVDGSKSTTKNHFYLYYYLIADERYNLEIEDGKQIG